MIIGKGESGMVDQSTIEYVIRWLDGERQRFQKQLATYETGTTNAIDSIPSAWPLESFDTSYKARLSALINDLTVLIDKYSSIQD
jgi:hypothetical protein